MPKLEGLYINPAARILFEVPIGGQRLKIRVMSGFSVSVSSQSASPDWRLQGFNARKFRLRSVFVGDPKPRYRARLYPPFAHIIILRAYVA